MDKLPQCYIPECSCCDKCGVPAVNPDSCPDKNCKFQFEDEQKE